MMNMTVAAKHSYIHTEMVVLYNKTPNSCALALGLFKLSAIKAFIRRKAAVAGLFT